MSLTMIERRYGPGNRDWLSEITATQTTWSGTPKALVIGYLRTARRVLNRVRAQAAHWPNSPRFAFELIHDRRVLPAYVASCDVMIRTRRPS